MKTYLDIYDVKSSQEQDIFPPSFLTFSTKSSQLMALSPKECVQDIMPVPTEGHSWGFSFKSWTHSYKLSDKLWILL